MKPSVRGLAAISTACLGAAAVAAAAENNNERPNILVIMTDDQGYGQLNFAAEKFDPAYLAAKFSTARYNCDAAKASAAARAAMPNITRLAQQGTSFSEAYVASPVCAPSRAAFITSRYPQRYGIYDNPDAHLGVNSKERFLPELLQKSGYRTAAIGKWHLSRCRGEKVESKSRDYHQKGRLYSIKEHHPLNRGFDYFYGFNSSGASYYNSPNIFKNYQNVKAPGYLTDRFTDETLNFIKQSGNKPFFVFLAYNAPHIPLEKRAPEKYQRFNTGNAEVDNYYAAIAAVDDGVGRIVAELKQQKKFKNTLIFYLSDNGAVIDSPQPANGYFKGFKGLTFQGGVHIPMVACWPGKIPAGKTYRKNVSAMDIMPSSLAAAGLKVPGNVDGVNLLPYIEGKKQGAPHEYLFWAGPRLYHWSDSNATFWRDYFKWITFKSDKKPSKVKKKGPASWTVLSGKWMLQVDATAKHVGLYDIEADPGEKHNVAAKHPAVVKRLSAAFVAWIKDKVQPLKWDKQRWQQLKATQEVTVK